MSTEQTVRLKYSENIAGWMNIKAQNCEVWPEGGPKGMDMLCQGCLLYL